MAGDGVVPVEPDGAQVRSCGEAYTASTTRRGSGPAGGGAQPRPQRAAAGAPVGAVRAQRGKDAAQGELPGVLRGEGGVVQGPALVDVAVDVGGGHAGRAQQEQVGQRADRARRSTTSSCCRSPAASGCTATMASDAEHVGGQEVVEHAEGVGEGVRGGPADRRPDPTHQHHDVGLVDRHPAPAVRRQRRAARAARGGRRRSGDPGRSQNSSPNQAGWVKWWRVIIGSRPRDGAHLEDLDVAVERGLVEPARPRAPGGPTRRRGGRWCTRWPPPGPAPPRGGPRSRMPPPIAPPGPSAPRPSQLLAGSPSPLYPPSIW